jgi:hypothetical protein
MSGETSQRVDARTIAKAALAATGHRSVSPSLEDWLTDFVELVRTLDRATR